MIRDVNQLHLNPLMDYIDGQTLTPMVKLSGSISNPNTHEPLQQQRATSDSYLDQALDTALRVHHEGVWRFLPADERAQRLEQIADALEPRLEEMAEIEALTTGVVIRQARALMRLVPLAFRRAAKHVRTGASPQALSSAVEVQRAPWGPAVLITPWSAAAVVAAYKTASALAAGCPVILKPSACAPHSSGIIAEVIADCDLPRGVFQLVHGDAEVAIKLASDPRARAISFTGRLEAARAVAQASAADLKPVQLEVSGVNPMIVLEDADLDAAADGAVNALTALSGQWMRGIGRLLVHRSRYNALLMKILERLETLQIGDALSPDSDMGPLIHFSHLQQVQAACDQLTACGGVRYEPTRLPDLPGYFMPPTLIANCRSSDALDEILGPVATVHMFKDDAEAIALANDPESANIAYIFSADEERARAIASELEIGNISINGVSLFGLHPQAPRAGWGFSGLGETGVAENFRFFTGSRAIGIAGGQ